ncbi:DEAD/DEAH box helicase, partial [Clostridium baratii]
DKYIEDILYMFDENSDFEKIDYIINSVYFRKHKIKLNYIKGIVDSYRSFLKEMKEGLDGIENSIAIYTYERIMLSCLIACDYYGTSEFMSNVEVSNIGKIDDINEFYKSYKDGEIYKLIRKYEKEHYGKDKDFSKVQNINILRNELFLDAEKELIKNKSKNIYYLEAPTGSGKSNVAMNLSFKLLEMDEKKNKIFYVYPFNTLIEQNISSINKIYSNNDEVLKKIAVINSLFPIKVEREEEFEDIEFKEYEKALLNRQFLNYPMILTTHVSIFRYMFGSRKEDIFPFHQLVNSVIVLDEIQSYKNKIWREIIEFLNTFSKILNIKIII